MTDATRESYQPVLDHGPPPAPEPDLFRLMERVTTGATALMRAREPAYSVPVIAAWRPTLGWVDAAAPPSRMSPSRSSRI